MARSMPIVGQTLSVLDFENNKVEKPTNYLILSWYFDTKAPETALKLMIFLMHI